MRILSFAVAGVCALGLKPTCATPASTPASRHAPATGATATATVESAECSMSSSQMATRGVMCGRPSTRTVAIQKSSAASSALRASSQLVAVAPGALNSAFNVVLGSVMN